MSETKDRESSKNKDNNTLDKDNKKRKRDESESDESEEDIPTRKKRITMTDCRKVFERMMEHEVFLINKLFSNILLRVKRNIIKIL